MRQLEEGKGARLGEIKQREGRGIKDNAAVMKRDYGPGVRRGDTRNARRGRRIILLWGCGRRGRAQG